MDARRTIAALFTAATATAGIAASAGVASAAPGTVFNPVVDGGFESTYVLEDGSPETDTWQYADNEYGYVACLKTSDWCGSYRSDIGPNTGTGWALFGDSNSPTHTSYLSQTVTVPVGATELTYYYRNASVDAPYNAILRVKVDGEVVNFHQEGTAATTDYAKYGAYIGQFADGEQHVLSFEYDGGSASTSGQDVNIMEIDDVAIG